MVMFSIICTRSRSPSAAHDTCLRFFGLTEALVSAVSVLAELSAESPRLMNSSTENLDGADLAGAGVVGFGGTDLEVVDGGFTAPPAIIADEGVVVGGLY